MSLLSGRETLQKISLPYEPRVSALSLGEFLKEEFQFLISASQSAQMRNPYATDSELIHYTIAHA